MEKLFTTESVTCGHPDKLSDLIADSILDAYLKADKDARVACEVAVGKNKVFIIGEITSKADIDIEAIARKVIVDVGYDRDELLFNGYNCKIIIDISKQSADIALGVNKKDIGAGDQGIMYGYATYETPNYMPLVHNLAHGLTKRLEEVRFRGIIKGLRPDGKAQLTLAYDNDKIVAKAIVVSCQHDEDKDLDVLKEEIENEVIKKVIPLRYITKDTKILINPTGRFVIGGPSGDTGLTGRKIMVDTYGGLAHHGGGAFSGKDYTKVDRSAAYYARYVAKNIVDSGLAKKCEVRVAYAIGVSKPVMVDIDTFNTNKISEAEILNIILKVFDFTPNNIIDSLGLKKVKYQDVTYNYHFGKESFPWEKCDAKAKILAQAKKYQVNL